MPKQVRPITFDEMGSLGLDEDNQLYWDDKPIEIKNRLSLGAWERMAVIIGGFSTLIIAIFTVLMYVRPAV